MLEEWGREGEWRVLEEGRVESVGGSGKCQVFSSTEGDVVMTSRPPPTVYPPQGQVLSSIQISPQTCLSPPQHPAFPNTQPQSHQNTNRQLPRQEHRATRTRTHIYQDKKNSYRFKNRQLPGQEHISTRTRTHTYQDKNRQLPGQPFQLPVEGGPAQHLRC